MFKYGVTHACNRYAQFVCKICNESFASKTHLGHHIHKTHNLSGIEYAIQYIFDGTPPTCKCGCGGVVEILKCPPYKRDYVFGHWPTPNIAELMTPTIRKKMSDKAIARMLRINRDEISGRIRSSKSATSFLDVIEKKFGITIEREFRLSNRFFDGRYKKLLIEIDGKYWHEKSRQRKIDSIKETLAKTNGYSVIRLIVNREADVTHLIEEYDKQLTKLFRKRKGGTHEFHNPKA